VIVSGVLAAIAFYFITTKMMTDSPIGAINLFYASLVGLVLTAALVVITEYYTATEYSPVPPATSACSFRCAPTCALPRPPITASMPH